MGHEYDALRNLEARLHAQEQHLYQVSADVQALKELAAANNTDIKELIDIAQGFKFGLKALGAVELGAVWIAKMAAAVVLLWGMWKYLIREAIASIGK